MRDLQQEVGDTHRQLEDLSIRNKDLTRKNKTLEGEYHQAKDDALVADKSRRSAEAERDELLEENQSLAPKMY